MDKPHKYYCLEMIKSYKECVLSITPYRCNDILYSLERFKCFSYIINKN